ncbi:hypothetical protein CDL15_Pgr009071 [Punica granatum]|uniref:Beta-glucosidase 24-like n=1 Tax=Punica granatum TaxID=22663 RepID=A0A218VZN7_PUNGR|nr:hypothetical protein CDL15_Pgr009071 [Punica granatum]
MGLLSHAPSASIFLLLIFCLSCIHYVASAKETSSELLNASDLSEAELNVKRSNFPRDFLFGAATSAVQTEGSASKYGKGPSVWDHYVQKFPGKVTDRSSPETAIDSYARYKDDVKLLKELGVDAYRFSIPWTRILPNGSLSGGVNQQAIDHYNDLINEVMSNGITPFVTLLHFDSPQILQDKYGGFLSHEIVDDFRDYAEICFRTYGDRVKHWITINEPLIIAQFGYDLGLAAPGRCSVPPNACPAGNSSTEPYIVTHNALLAHAAAAGLYKDKFQAEQRGEIGISLVGEFFEPYSESSNDKKAARRAMDFHVGWFLNPLVYGEYPRRMRNLVKGRLPTFSEGDKALVQGSLDFIGFSYYTSRYAKAIEIDPNVPPTSFSRDSFTDLQFARDGVPIGKKASGSDFIYIYPKGLGKLLTYTKRKYKSPKIYITENGISEAKNDSQPIHEALQDPHRIQFILQHLYQINRAIKKGVDVKGYFYWSQSDSFEFGKGRQDRYGLYYIDYQNNLTRIPKHSAKWLPSFLRNKGRTQSL